MVLEFGSCIICFFVVAVRLGYCVKERIELLLSFQQAFAAVLENTALTVFSSLFLSDKLTRKMLGVLGCVG